MTHTPKATQIVRAFASLIVMLPMISVGKSLPTDDTARLKVGINAQITNQAFAVKDKLSVMPHAFYDNNRLYLEGSEGGAYVYKDNTHHARVGLSYDGRHFEPSDTSGNLQRLNERKPSVLAHASYMYVSKFGGIRTKVANDILNKHNGLTASVSHISRFDYGRATLYPSFGLNWHSSDYNNYYYGVNQDQSVVLGVHPYQAGASISPFVSATLNYELNQDWSMFVNTRAEWLGTNQKKSPLVDNTTQLVGRVGVSYQF